MKLFKKIIGIISVCLVSIFGYATTTDYLGSTNYERNSYDIIGTATTPTTTNSLYGGNTKTFVSGGFDKLHLDIQYLPKTTSSTLFILVEGSNDGGTTFFPLVSRVREYDGIVDQLNIDPTGVTSTQGIPLAFPNIVSGSMSDSVANTTYKAMVDLIVNAGHLKVSVKESTTSTKGTSYIRATLLNN